MVGTVLTCMLVLGAQSHFGDRFGYESVLHALPDGSPDRSVPANKWVEVRESADLVGSLSNATQSPSPFPWRCYGKEDVAVYGSGDLPRGAQPFSLPEPGARPLRSQLKTFLYVSRDPVPAMSTRQVYWVHRTVTEVEFRRSGTQEAVRWRTTRQPVGFKEETQPIGRG